MFVCAGAAYSLLAVVALAALAANYDPQSWNLMEVVFLSYNFKFGKFGWHKLN
jgi:hypothetical protein